MPRRSGGEHQAGVAGSDRFSVVYFACVALVFLLFAAGADLDRIFNLRHWLAPLVFIPALAVLIGWTMVLIRNVALRRWRRVVSVAVAPLAAHLLLSAAGVAGVNSQRIRFEIGRRTYLAQIAKLEPSGEPRLLLFDWGQTGGLGTTSWIETLVYDEADEISLPPQQLSPAWRERAGKRCPGTPMCALLWPYAAKTIVVRKIEGHFYLMTEAY
jgi:hypothetical protein